MTTTDTNQQSYSSSFDMDVEGLELLTKQAFANDPAYLEFELREERIRPYLVDITKPMEEVKPLISIGDKCVCSAGNISAIVGEAKSKKTFLTTALVASAFAYTLPDSQIFENVSNNMNLTVLWLDTEQGEAHVRKVIDRINKITGINDLGQQTDPRLRVFALREIDPEHRRDVMRDAIFTFSPDIVVIDGIADLQYDTNDLRESDALIGELMTLSTTYKCHIICVLHTNPGTDKARGHIGSSLQRKAESVLFVHRDNDISIVEPQFCRNEPFERFAFHITDTGLPEICSLPTDPTSKEDEIVGVLNSHFGGSIERNVLINKVEEVLGLTHNAAKVRVCRAVKKGKLNLHDGVVTSYTSYRGVTESYRGM